MSIHAYAWAWAQQLDPSEKLLLLAIADHLNSETNRAFPSVRRLMKFTGLSERHVRRCLGSLESADYIEKADAYNDAGRQISNTYRFRTEVRPLEIGRISGEDGSDLRTARARFDRTITGDRGDSGGTPSPDGDGMGVGDSGVRGVGDSDGTPISRINNRNKKPSGTKVALRADWPSDAFDRFYENYPHKVGKAAARRAFEKVQRNFSSGLLWADFCAGVRRYTRKTDDRPWCNPATFLNQERWADQPAAVVPNGRGPNGSPSFFDVAMGRG
jgi:hypothetical protein